MKMLYFFLLMLLPLSGIHAQPCTIKISYDDNGNRILREMECLSPRPQDDPDDDVVLTRRKASRLDSSLMVSGTFKVYPNPTADEVFVHLDEISLQQNCSIVLIDQLGREHFRKEKVNARTRIALGHLPDGIYHILLWRGAEKSAVKIVKEAR